MPLNERKLGRLQRAWDYSYKKLETHRTKRKQRIREYIGDGNLINLLAQAVNIYARYLIGREPKVLVTSRIPRYGHTAINFGIAVSQDIRRIKLSRTLRTAVVDALFAEAWIKMGKTATRDVSDDAPDFGELYVRTVDYDDVCYDMNALSWDEVQFMGNNYKLPLDWVKKSDLYRNTKDLVACDRMTLPDGEERASDMTRRLDGEPDLYMDMVSLRDVFLPADRILVTVPTDRPERSIREIGWVGPASGPYKRMGFFEIPSQVVFLSMVGLLSEMSRKTNSIFAKAISDEEAGKTVYRAQSAGADDARKIIDAAHGEVITGTGQQPLERLDLMGANAKALGLVPMMRDLVNYLGGNLDAIGGLAPQSPTLGQDELISKSASRMVAQMQECVADFTREIVRDIGWYRWTDQMPVEIERELPGGMVFTTFGPDRRRGSFYDYLLDIEPYSIPHRTPSERLGQYMQGVQLAMQLAELMQGGGPIDGKAVMQTYCRLTDLPELEAAITRSDTMPSMQQEGEQTERRMPNTTRRVYERVNRSERTQRGTDNQWFQNAMALAQQEDQMRGARQ